MKRVIVLVAATILIVPAARALASDPVGIYAVIERVELEPNSVEPDRVQLWGWFEMADKSSRRYQEPRHGCLYYSLAEGKADVCRREWRDLADSARTGKCVAFGQRHTELGKIRKFGDKLDSPTPYPVAAGLFELHDDTDYEPISALAELPLIVSPSDGCLTPPGLVEIKIKNIRGPHHERAKYRFEIAERGHAAVETSEPVAPGEDQTVWSPKLQLKAGKEYVWRVRAVDGD
ncbi:MAG TPA: hypothetical protein VGX78_16695, partial [Pirellulales bacterium]|nr:hypothetical protein [Pirellulales bacterium]